MIQRMKIAYVRVSPDEQKVGLQRDTLEAAGWRRSQNKQESGSLT
jgi:DNA invertase Pin-like site-specific DNA recombinase